MEIRFKLNENNEKDKMIISLLNQEYSAADTIKSLLYKIATRHQNTLLPLDVINLEPKQEKNDRNSSEYIKWREDVLERDNNTCVCCGASKRVVLNVHHLDGYNWCLDKRVEADNGVTLCENCHKEFHKKYGKGNNTKEQFEEFINEVYVGSNIATQV